MALSATLRTIVSGIGADVDSVVPVSGSGGIVIDETIANPSTDQQLDCAFDLQRLVAFFMVSTKALTIHTNAPAGSSPQETITLAANQGFLYVPGAGLPSPFADDVTKLYVTNASGAAARLQIRVLLDVTP